MPKPNAESTLLSYAAMIPVSSTDPLRGWMPDGYFADDAIRVDRYLHEYKGSGKLRHADDVSTAGTLRVHLNANAESNAQKQDNWVDFDTQWVDSDWHHVASEWELRGGAGVARLLTVCQRSARFISALLPLPLLCSSCSKATGKLSLFPRSRVVQSDREALSVQGRGTAHAFLGQHQWQADRQEPQGRRCRPDGVPGLEQAVWGVPSAGAEPGVPRELLRDPDSTRRTARPGAPPRGRHRRGTIACLGTLGRPPLQHLSPYPCPAARRPNASNSSRWPQVRIWGRALNESQVIDVMNKAWKDLTPDQQREVSASYEFSASAGDNITRDDSRNANHLYLGEQCKESRRFGQ